MLVVDNSLIVRVLTGARPDITLLRRLSEESLHAPHIIDVEFLNVMRGLTRGKKLSLDRAHDARRDFFSLPISRYPVGGIGDRIWALRHNLTAYDACYLALAEVLRCPLATCDAKMARATGHDATVEVFNA